MTKIIKWWMRFSFWFKVRTFLGSIGIGSEFAAYWVEASKGVHAAIGGATLIALLITFLFTDEDKNDIVDFFQKTRRKP